MAATSGNRRLQPSQPTRLWPDAPVLVHQQVGALQVPASKRAGVQDSCSCIQLGQGRGRRRHTSNLPQLPATHLWMMGGTCLCR